jgi:hypothetical protein
LLKVVFTYNAQTWSTNDFTIEVKCPVLTVNTITSTFTKDLSNAALTETLVNSGYVTGTSTSQTACVISYVVVKSADSLNLGGSWLTTNAAGAVLLDRAVLGTKSVKIKYTQATVDAYTNAFTVTVGCPSLTTATPNALYSFNVPNAAAGATTQVIAMNIYLTNPSTQASCGITFSLVEASDGTTPVAGTWLTATSAGIVKVNTDILGDKTVKVKYIQTGSSTTALSSAF